MKNISLLPPEIKAEARARRRRNLYLLVSVGVLAGFVIFYSILHIETARTRSELRTLEEEREIVATEMDALGVYREMQADVEAAERMVQQAMGTTPSWGELLETVGLKVPHGIQLTDLNASYNNDSGELTLRGRADSHITVARWLEQMHEIPLLDRIYCQFADEGLHEGRVTVQFEVKARILPGEPYRLVIEGGA